MRWPCARARKLFIFVTRLMAPVRLVIPQCFKIIEVLFLVSSASHIMPGSVISMDTLTTPNISPTAVHQHGARNSLQLAIRDIIQPFKCGQ